MTYCETAIHINEEEVEHVLSRFTQENFVGGRAAYLLDDGTYSVDAGENDLRAIYDNTNGIVKFISRYQSEVPRYEKIIQSFAAKYDILITAPLTP